ncbi:hypothetical protein BD410DRAFT_553799 [Rickenella mellea]|uniref:F-box domain-containing protein n=1 Tax=Rickenella mellea TaxID=50990 RepID=A0A4Y7PR03_9AGAM|nr:hypothetical protein BD410DRAFT_553799 [Rickenella mellea]
MVETRKRTSSRNTRKSIQRNHSLSTSKITPLDRLISLLNRVRDDGPQETFALDTIWDEQFDMSFANHVHPPDPHELLALRRALSEAKTCMVALKDIKYQLGRRMRTLQNRCTPLVLSDGLSRLPDEILANVFEMGHNLSDDYKFSLTMSHVCHRFRAVALRIPLLWARLDTKTAPLLTNAFIVSNRKSASRCDLLTAVFTDVPIESGRDRRKL